MGAQRVRVILEKQAHRRVAVFCKRPVSRPFASVAAAGGLSS
ncbi:Unknown protein sequence [Pseudomonas coronafaciens pv. oryzae]|nr:Unknown protein sequence [Pseudomonas coronafaciens pv. oryzae]